MVKYTIFYILQLFAVNNTYKIFYEYLIHNEIVHKMKSIINISIKTNKN